MLESLSDSERKIFIEDMIKKCRFYHSRNQLNFISLIVKLCDYFHFEIKFTENGIFVEKFDLDYDFVLELNDYEKSMIKENVLESYEKENSNFSMKLNYGDEYAFYRILKSKIDIRKSILEKILKEID